MHENTRDFMKFGHRERQEAGKLLTTLCTNKDQTKFLGNNVAVEFNMMSCNVFLVDEDFNVAMLNEDMLEDFISCPYCGSESFYSEFKEENRNQCCQNYFKDISL